MRSRRFALGVVASLSWLIASALLLYLKRSDLSTLPPNAWGDFFAGIFAPLAFLWLVLGYLQQGEELKLSTDALRLQAEELKHSVEQQRALVEVSRQQVESERATLEYERHLREEAAKPNFLIAAAGGSFRGDGHSNYNFIISNTGNMASIVVGELTLPDEMKVRVIDLPIFDKGYQHRTAFELSSPLECTNSQLVISYRDALGRDGSTVFSVRRKTEHPHSELSFSRVWN